MLHIAKRKIRRESSYMLILIYCAQPHHILYWVCLCTIHSRPFDTELSNFMSDLDRLLNQKFAAPFLALRRHKLGTSLDRLSLWEAFERKSIHSGRVGHQLKLSALSSDFG